MWVVLLPDGGQQGGDVEVRGVRALRPDDPAVTLREIAGALTIAPKTAAAHLEHIRTKLGVSRRAQIAAWVAALD